ncbi:hypothetical protein VULLAG_LOCUS3989 [Vulpes lagopus]
MEAAASGRRPGQEPLGRRGGFHRNSKGICPKADLSFAEKGEDARSCERQRKAGTTEPREGLQSTGAVTRPSQGARGPAHKRPRSADGRPDGHCRENGPQAAEPAGGGRSPARGRSEGRPGRRGAAQRPRRLARRTTRPGSPARPAGRGRRRDPREPRPASPKRRRPSGPEAREPLAAVGLRLWRRLGALEVALAELRAPGGAFLAAPSGRPQPAASQRAWLSWQLAHAGAPLHWAAAQLHRLLAAPPGP